MATFQLVTSPHPLVAEIFAKRHLPLESGGTTPLDVYIPPEQGNFLYSLIRHYRPAVTIEIGMANGLSTLFITSAHADNGAGGRHIAIDPFQSTDWRNIGVGLIRLAGLEKFCRLVELPSHQALPDLEREGVRAGLVFIDGSHLFDYVMADFLCVDRILDVGGLMVFDDSDWPAVRPVIRYVVTNRHYTVAHPDVAIEAPPGRVSLAAKVLRAVARAIPAFGSRLRPSFLVPDEEMGLNGRCIVLRKEAEEDRDSQQIRNHQDY